jgi:Protein of unknown function (DUF1571)
MHGGNNTAWGLAGVALCLAVCGCVGLSGRQAPTYSQAAARAKLFNPRETAAPELRIPPEAVAQNTEIPLVPVPLPPLGGDTRPRNAPIQPVNFPTSQPPAPPGTGPTTPEPAPAGDGVATTPRQLIQQAAATFAGIDSYIARMTRREVVGNEQKPEEVIQFMFRKDPWSVRFKWVGAQAQGREVIYVKDQFENKIHTLVAAGDSLLIPAGRVMSLEVDNFFVRQASRHSITEAGMGATIDRLARLQDALERGATNRGQLKLLGLQPRKDYDGPLEMLEQTLPPGFDVLLPRGGKRLIGFDPRNHLPVLLTTLNDRNQEVEYYRYDRVLYPVKLDADDFNPDRAWRKSDPRSAQAKP